MTQINQNKKIKFLILVNSLKNQIIMLKLLKQKIKYQILVAQLQMLHRLQLKIKYLILVVQSKNKYNTEISRIEKKLTNNDHDRYITTPEFNKFAAEVSKTKSVFVTKLKLT